MATIRPSTWIPRISNKRAFSSISPDKISVYIHSLRTSVVIDKSSVTCPICDELLPESFSTLKCDHSVCVACIQKCVRGNQFSCPTCRSLTSNLTRKDLILCEILRTLPRPVPCGESLAGWLAAKEHEKTCVACIKKTKLDVEQELAALKRHCTTLETKNTSLTEANAVLVSENENLSALCEETLTDTEIESNDEYETENEEEDD